MNNLEKHERVKPYIKDQFNIIDFSRLGFENANKIMVIGPLDSGKTFLCRKILSFFLLKKLSPVCFFDLDLGQTSIGPPCTIGTTYPNSEKQLENLSDNPIANLAFIGSLYPYGFENKIYKSIRKILELPPNESRIVIDTTGFKNINNEVITFKCEKTKIIAPDIVILLAGSLNNNTKYFQLLKETTEKVEGKLLLFPPQSNFAFKTKSIRRAHHLKAFSYWLEGATQINLPSNLLNCDKVIMPKKEGRLVGLIDEGGLCVGGGILISENNNNLTIYGKLKPGGNISTIDIGTLKFEIDSWEVIYES